MGGTSQGKGYYIDFIDPLFAVVLHISFTHVVMEQPWFQDLWVLLSRDALFGFLSLFLGYALIVQSWVGYHQSIAEKPIRGRGRFFIDIFLLTAYLLLLLKFQDFNLALVLLTLIFFLFVLWDKFKTREYGEEAEAKLRRKVTMFWFYCYLGLYLANLAMPSWEWVFLVLAICGVWAYRSHKGRLWWRWGLERVWVP